MRASSIVLTLLGLLSLAAPAASQPQPPAAAAQPQRPRAVQTLSLTTSAWTDGGSIPAKHAQMGRDTSPPLSWSGAPEGVVSYVLLVRDLDTIAPATGEDALHWLVWNIAGTATSLPEGMPQGNAVPPAGQGGGGFGAPRVPTDGPRQISGTGPYYRGPAAPSTGPAHHYLFELFALDAWVDVPAVGQSPSATRAAVTAAMAGHVRGKGVLVGTYRRPAP